MSNPEIILGVLDAKLDHEVRLILYGRAAIHLGFADAPEETGRSLDIDGIVPMSDLEALVNDGGFWDAVEATNTELHDRSLYVTHLFQEDQVVLRSRWLDHLVPITRPPLRCLRLFRPATLDLVLTKMMRGDDPQDLADIAFLVRNERLTLPELESAFAEARIPDLEELRDAFELAKPHIRQLFSEP